VEQAYLGIDLGGSNIVAALITGSGKILELEKIETLAHLGHQKIILRIIEVAQTVLKKSGIKPRELKAIGIGVPGVIDVKQGIVRYSPNLPGWKNIHLREKITTALKKTVFMDNDAM